MFVFIFTHCWGLRHGSGNYFWCVGKSQNIFWVRQNAAYAVQVANVRLYILVKQCHTRLQALGLELIPVSWQSGRTWFSHKPYGRLPLLSARPTFTFPAIENIKYLVLSLSFQHFCVGERVILRRFTIVCDALTVCVCAAVSVKCSHSTTRRFSAVLWARVSALRLTYWTDSNTELCKINMRHTWCIV